MSVCSRYSTKYSWKRWEEKSQTLPPKSETFLENAKRVHMQTLIWKSTLELDCLLINAKQFWMEQRCTSYQAKHCHDAGKYFNRASFCTVQLIFMATHRISLRNKQTWQLMYMFATYCVLQLFEKYQNCEKDGQNKQMTSAILMLLRLIESAIVKCFIYVHAHWTIA